MARTEDTTSAAYEVDSAGCQHHRLDGKRNWDSVRPITAVRWLMRGKTIQAWGGPYKGPSYIKGEDWIPYQAPHRPHPTLRRVHLGALHVQLRGG